MCISIFARTSRQPRAGEPRTQRFGLAQLRPRLGPAVLLISFFRFIVLLCIIPSLFTCISHSRRLVSAPGPARFDCSKIETCIFRFAFALARLEQLRPRVLFVRMVKVPVEEATPVKKGDVESATRPSTPVGVANGRIEGVKRSLKPRHTTMIAIGGEFPSLFAPQCFWSVLERAEGVWARASRRLKRKRCRGLRLRRTVLTFSLNIYRYPRVGYALLLASQRTAERAELTRLVLPFYCLSLPVSTAHRTLHRNWRSPFSWWTRWNL